MSLEKLNERYKHIAKQSLQFLKNEGFTKRGMRYLKEKGELILVISSAIPRAWMNSEHHYEFQIYFELMTNDHRFVDLYMYIEGERNLKAAPLLSGVILPNFLERSSYLKIEDPPEWDDQFITGVKEKIEIDLLPWFNNLNSIDDVMNIAEEEIKMPREQRKYFAQTNIYRDITNFYAAKGWNDKAVEMCEKFVERTPQTARVLTEKIKKKYLQYIELHR